MKGKIPTYLLLFVVLTIWGVLIYKFASDLSDDSIVQNKLEQGTFKKPVSVSTNPFELLPVEQDPFLGTLYREKEKKTTSRNTTIKILWPQLHYDGIVSDGKGKSKVFLVNINGIQHLLKTGDTISSIKVVRGNAKSVFLRYKGQTKEFTIE